MLAKNMRHLRVPSAKTAFWVERCKTNGWYELGSGVLPLGDERGIPLNNSAPQAGEVVWEGFLITNEVGTAKKTQHWTEHLPAELLTNESIQFPQSYEIQGDVLLIKIPEEIEPIENEIAQAMLKQYPNVRIVCHDEGVDGEFRIRRLRILSSKDGSTTTQTRVKEHGHFIHVDPAHTYFSGRLSEQRMLTHEAVLKFREGFDRPLVVFDPYAGVGPSMAYLYTDSNLTNRVYVNDMNPNTRILLENNMAVFDKKRSIEGTYVIDTMDARKIASSRPETRNDADVLLVNLPHDGTEHLPELLPLLSAKRAMLCGWSIIEKSQTDGFIKSLETILRKGGREIESHHLDTVKGFSAAKAMVRYECVLASETNR